MQGLRQEEVSERQKTGGIDLLCQLGGNSNQLCFSEIRAKGKVEGWELADGGENGVRAVSKLWQYSYHYVP